MRNSFDKSRPASNDRKDHKSFGNTRRSQSGQTGERSGKPRFKNDERRNERPGFNAYRQPNQVEKSPQYKENKFSQPQYEEDIEAGADGIIEGRNAVHEALRAGRVIDKLFFVNSDGDGMLSHLAMKAKEAGAVVVDCDRRKLDAMSKTHAHQGIIAIAAVHEYSTVDDILESVKKSGRPALIVVCDEISDPHNLGAIIRSAEAAGAHGVIIPKRRSAGLTAVVSKASAGAVEHIPVARVPNIPTLLKDLKKQGIWVYGTALEAESDLYDSDLTGPAAIVIGSEGEGIGRLVSEQCDYLVKIPMLGRMESLNASAAAAVILYEAVRQRQKHI